MRMNGVILSQCGFLSFYFNNFYSRLKKYLFNFRNKIQMKALLLYNSRRRVGPVRCTFVRETASVTSVR